MAKATFLESAINRKKYTISKLPSEKHSKLNRVIGLLRRAFLFFYLLQVKHATLRKTRCNVLALC